MRVPVLLLVIGAILVATASNAPSLGSINEESGDSINQVIQSCTAQLIDATAETEIESTLIELLKLSAALPLKDEHKEKIMSLYKQLVIANPSLSIESSVCAIKMMMNQNYYFKLSNLLELSLWNAFFAKIDRLHCSVDEKLGAVSMLSALIQRSPFDCSLFHLSLSRFYTALIQNVSDRSILSQGNLFSIIIKMLQQSSQFGLPHLDISVWNEFGFQFYQCPSSNLLDSSIIQLLEFQFNTSSKPNVVTFNNILRGIAESTTITNPDETTCNLLDFMRKHRIEPNQENYQQQLRIFIQTKNTPKVTELLFDRLIISNRTKAVIAAGGIALINAVLDYLPIRYPQQFPMRILWLLNHIKPENILMVKGTYWILSGFREKYANSTNVILDKLYFDRIRQSNCCVENYGTVWQIIQRIREIKVGMRTCGYMNWLKVIPREARPRHSVRPPDILMHWNRYSKEKEKWCRRLWNMDVPSWRRRLHKYDHIKLSEDRWVVDKSAMPNATLQWVNEERDSDGDL